jgi:hypothetical protein
VQAFSQLRPRSPGPGTASRPETAPPWPSGSAPRWLTWRNAVGVTVVAFALPGLAVAGPRSLRSAIYSALLHDKSYSLERVEIGLWVSL